MSVAEAVTLADGLRAQRVGADAIPIVDFAPFLAGGFEDRRRVAQEIGRACREIGFFYIANHGVPQDLVDRTFAETKRFFSLPRAEKAKISVTLSKNHRGYFASGEENLDPAKQPTGDFKEGVNIGRDLGPDDPDVRAGTPLHGPNQWPDNLPGWREHMEAYYGLMQDLGARILAAFALALDMPEDFFADKIMKPMTTLRLLYYPPQRGRITEDQIGAGAHTDFGGFTMLAQDEVGGLQVRGRDGQWIDATPIAGTFVVNVGDMMARWTNDRFASTLHRVVNVSGRERYSIPFFFDPDFRADVSCLPTCLDPGETPHYPPTTGGQHLLDKIDETFEYRRRKD
jgi:isopenicillin N synthase-like dioxygenase